MATFIGNRKIKDLYLGNRKVDKIYKGNDLIYESFVAPIIWNRVSTPYRYARSVVYGNNLFAMVCGRDDSEGRVYTSTNGINWTSHTLPGRHNWVSIEFANGVFATNAADMGTVYYSTDGNTWSAGGSIGVGRKIFTANNMFFAFSTQSTKTATFYTSTNGITWTSRNLPTSINQNYMGNVGYFNGKYYFSIFGTSSSDCILYTSTNGINWTSSSQNFGAGNFASFNNRLFTWGKYISSSKGYETTDGINWTEINIGKSINGLSYGIYGKNVFVAPFLSSYDSAYTRNGKDWFTFKIEGLTSALSQLAYGNGKFILTNQNDYYFYCDIGA